MIEIYCECCGEHRPFIIEHMTKDDLNPFPWGDIVCKKCSFVITSLRADEPGIYEFVKVGETNEPARAE